MSFGNAGRIGKIKNAGFEPQLSYQVEITGIEKYSLFVADVLVCCGGVTDGRICNGNILR